MAYGTGAGLTKLHIFFFFFFWRRGEEGVASLARISKSIPHRHEPTSIDYVIGSMEISMVPEKLRLESGS